MACGRRIGMYGCTCLILPQNKPFSSVYTAKYMVNYIIYRCQYDTVPDNLSSPSQHGSHALLEKFMLFVCCLLVFSVPLLNVNLGLGVGFITV